MTTQRISPNLYRIGADLFARRRPDGWYAVNEAGDDVSGPHANVLDIVDTPHKARQRARERRASILQRTRTTRSAAGVVVRVTHPAGHAIAATAVVRKVADAGPFRWNLSTREVGGDAPLFIAAVIAAAHAIDESEPAS